MYVKPAAGRKVRDPISKQHLPEAGAEVPDSVYWRRRIKAGDVILATKAAPAAAAPSKHSKE